MHQWIAESLTDPPPSLSQDIGFIREGYSAELDELRQIAFEGKDWIARMENEERQKTGISSLKVRYNKVFGYYIEITRSNLGSVPEHYVRKQTIANGERYITAELKDFESKVLTAQEKMAQMEKSLFQEILTRLSTQVPRMQETAKALATLDVLAALAEVANVQCGQRFCGLLYPGDLRGKSGQDFLKEGFFHLRHFFLRSQDL